MILHASWSYLSLQGADRVNWDGGSKKNELTPELPSLLKAKESRPLAFSAV